MMIVRKSSFRCVLIIYSHFDKTRHRNDVYLMLQKVCEQLRIPHELNQHFSLFVQRQSESGESSRKLNTFDDCFVDEFPISMILYFSHTLTAKLRMSGYHIKACVWPEQSSYQKKVSQQ